MLGLLRVSMGGLLVGFVLFSFLGLVFVYLRL